MLHCEVTVLEAKTDRGDVGGRDVEQPGRLRRNIKYRGMDAPHGGGEVGSLDFPCSIVSGLLHAPALVCSAVGGECTGRVVVTTVEEGATRLGAAHDSALEEVGNMQGDESLSPKGLMVLV